MAEPTQVIIKPLFGYRRSVKPNLKTGDVLGIHGEVYNLYDPKTLKIDVPQMGIGLGRLARYYGDTGFISLANANNIYTVAQHIVLGCRAALMFGDVDLAMEFFVHDLTENWLGDLKSPIKALLGDKYKEIEDSYGEHIAKHFGVQWPLSENHKILDTNMAEWETTVFMGPDCTLFQDYWTPEKAAREFISVYEEIRTLQKLRA